MQIVYIEWLDSMGLGGRNNKKEAMEAKLLLVTTAGILVGEDEEVVRIAQDWWTWEDGDGTRPEIYREVLVIPKKMVQRFEIMEVPVEGGDSGEG